MRVDGNAVIKKKYKGIYTTLAQKKIYSGTYDPVNYPSLLPKNTWIGLRIEVSTLPSDKVEIKLYQDLNWKVQWSQILTAVDSASPITNPGKAGIRTDFMDIEFDNYSIN